MSIIYKRMCIPLMQINSNVYAFISGILISLATNIFTTLCFEPFKLSTQWHQYLSTGLFIISGAICMYIAVKIVDFQSYIYGKKIVKQQEKYEIIIDATEEKSIKWVISFLAFIITLIAGFVFLALNIIVNVHTV